MGLQEMRVGCDVCLGETRGREREGLRDGWGGGGGGIESVPAANVGKKETGW